VTTQLAAAARVRRFNRFYTRRIGLLDAGHLHTPFSLAEARRQRSSPRSISTPDT
jgi:hypothetical protein